MSFFWFWRYHILLGSTINNSTHLLSTLKGYHVWVGSRMRKSFAVYPGCHVRCSSTWSVQSSRSSGICCDCGMSGCCVEHFSFFYKWWKWKWKSPSHVWLCNYIVHGILQARILEWVDFLFSRGSSQPRDWTQVFHIAGRLCTNWATREAQEYWSG